MTKEARFLHRLRIDDLSKKNGVIVLKDYNPDFDKPIKKEKTH